MYKKLLLKVYNATVLSSKFKTEICRKMFKTSSQELQLYSLWTFLKAFRDNEDSKLLKQ